MTPLVLLGEARGENEAKINSSFVGSSGIELLRMLDEAGVITFTSEDRTYISRYYASYDPNMIECVWRMHPEVFRTNVFQQHPPGNKLEFFCGPKAEGIKGYPALLKSKYVRKEFEYELDRLGEELLCHNPNLVLCLGNSALWAMLGQTGVTKLRGTTCLSSHVASGFKLLPTYHPAAVLRQWELRPTVIMDLHKAAREAAYPEIRRTKREIWIEPTTDDIRTFFAEHISEDQTTAVDIETSGTQITCIGFSPGPHLGLVVPFVDGRRKDRSYWRSAKDEQTVWGIVRGFLEDRRFRKVFQNGLYDIAFLWRSVGIKVLGASEDTMLLHHALQPESLKGLGYLASCYCDEGAWKQMRKGSATIKKDD